VLPFDAGSQLLHLRRPGVIHSDSNASPANGSDISAVSSMVSGRPGVASRESLRELRPVQ
jgi:hypothetical protein